MSNPNEIPEIQDPFQPIQERSLTPPEKEIKAEDVQDKLDAVLQVDRVFQNPPDDVHFAMQQRSFHEPEEKYKVDIHQDIQFELSLEDQFLHHEVETRAFVVEPQREIKAESEALPSVLVDEVLMQEIASIPDRFGFKIGDVADLLGIKQYVLRYWEQEFELLKPKKASNNQRLYTKKDVENAFLIKKLLYRDKFSIEGARQALKDVKFAVKKEKDLSSVIQRMDLVQDHIRAFVNEIRKTKSLFS